MCVFFICLVHFILFFCGCCFTRLVEYSSIFAKVLVTDTKCSGLVNWNFCLFVWILLMCYRKRIWPQFVYQRSIFSFPYFLMLPQLRLLFIFRHSNGTISLNLLNFYKARISFGCVFVILTVTNYFFLQINKIHWFHTCLHFSVCPYSAYT